MCRLEGVAACASNGCMLSLSACVVCMTMFDGTLVPCVMVVPHAAVLWRRCIGFGNQPAEITLRRWVATARFLGGKPCAKTSLTPPVAVHLIMSLPLSNLAGSYDHLYGPIDCPRVWSLSDESVYLLYDGFDQRIVLRIWSTAGKMWIMLHWCTCVWSPTGQPGPYVSSSERTLNQWLD